MPVSAAKLERMHRKIGRMFKAEVPDTSEFRRVAALRRRDWKTEIVEGVGDVEAVTDALTSLYRTPNGTMRLHPHQAKALQELMDFGYSVVEFDVGDGKTLFSFLAAHVLADTYGVERPLVLVPSKLEEKTHRDFEKLSRDWQRPTVPIEVSVFELISREGGMEILERINPDALLVDEVHRLKNPSAAVTQKIEQWVTTHRTFFLPMTATYMNRSIYEYAHFFRWAVPEDRVPLPEDELELKAWAAAVDEIKVHEDRAPGKPGALKLLCNEEELKQGRQGVRNALRRRVRETPGFVATEGSDCQASLNIELVLVDGYNEQTLEHAQGLLNDEKPNGEPITENDFGARWALFRQLTSGFWYRRNPPPPEEWLKCRRRWLGKCKRVLDLRAPGYESMMLVAKAAKAGKLDRETCEAYAKWKAVEGMYRETVEPVWVDDRMVEFVASWAKKNTGIVWVSEIALGERLERDLGFSYFHTKGFDSKGRYIDDAPNDRCIVASVNSNKEGRNLQHKWHRNVVLSCMPVGNDWHQTIGREHRFGQKEDEVWFDIAIGCSVEWECWQQAKRDALASGAKKLLIATVTEFDPPWGSNALWN